MLIDFDEARSIGLLLSNSQIYRNQGQPGFPKIVRPSANRSALVREEVLAYLREKIAERDAALAAGLPKIVPKRTIAAMETARKVREVEAGKSAPRQHRKQHRDAKT